MRLKHWFSATVTAGWSFFLPSHDPVLLVFFCLWTTIPPKKLEPRIRGRSWMDGWNTRHTKYDIPRDRDSPGWLASVHLTAPRCDTLFRVSSVLIGSFPAPALSHSCLVTVWCRTPVFPPIHCGSLSLVSYSSVSFPVVLSFVRIPDSACFDPACPPLFGPCIFW